MVHTLHQIQAAGHTTAIIAGGAIRDTYHDQMVTDVDIFIQHPSTLPAGSLRASGMPPQQFKHADWEDYWADVMRLRTSPSSRSYVRDSVRWHHSSYDGDSVEDNLMPELLSVWNVFKGLNMYQVIFTTVNPVEYVNDRFDFGLCKAYCDGKRTHLTDDFLRDSRNKTITMVGKEMSSNRVAYAISEHLPRIKEKYPGFQSVIPCWYVE